MKIGLGRPHGDPGFPVNDIDMGAIAILAEEFGFTWLSYGHHTVRPLHEPIVGPHQQGVPLYQDPLIGAARATALTRELEIVVGVLIMPMKHPVDVAKQAASIDLYSGGRLLLGLGAGGASRMEIEASGGRWDRRWAYTMESIEVLKGLWGPGGFRFEGEFFSIPEVLLAPKPARDGGPPILLGGFSDLILERVARHADGWLPAYAGTRLIRGGDQTGPDHLRQGCARLKDYAEQAGRADKRFEIGVCVLHGEHSRDLARRYEDAGADRLALGLPCVRSIEEARREIELIAQAVL